MRTLQCLILLSLVTGASSSRLTATTISVVYGQMYPTDATVTSDFNTGLVLPSGFTSAGNAGIIPGSVSEHNRYDAPSGDTTNYAYVSGGGRLTETFSSPMSYFGLYWGSPDVYNTLTLTETTGATESYSPGSTLAGLTPDQLTAAYVSFTANGAPWVSVEFDSNGPAFEFDNVSTSTAAPAPEPGTILLTGITILILGLWRRWKDQAVGRSNDTAESNGLCPNKEISAGHDHVYDPSRCPCCNALLTPERTSGSPDERDTGCRGAAGSAAAGSFASAATEPALRRPSLPMAGLECAENK